MRRFSGSADPSAPHVTITSRVRRLAHRLLPRSFGKRSSDRRPRDRKTRVIFAMIAAVSGGLAGWLGPIELVVLLVLALHVGIAILIAGGHDRTPALPGNHLAETAQPLRRHDPVAHASGEHRLLRLAARATEQGQLTEAGLIYQRAIRECAGNKSVQDIARHSLENLDLSRKIVKSA